MRSLLSVFWSCDLAPSNRVDRAPQSSTLNSFFRPQRWILAHGQVQDSTDLGASLPSPPEGMNPKDIVAWYHSRGGFEIRPVDRSMEEIKVVAALQGRSFFQSPTWGPAFLSTVALQSTTAEALDALSQNLRYTPKDKFACLVVKLRFEGQRTRGITRPRDVEGSQDQTKQNKMKKTDIIGVVHLGVHNSAAVIAEIKKHDPTNDTILRKSLKRSSKKRVVSAAGSGVSDSTDHGDALVEEYAYLSSMAVEEGMRRKGVAKFMVQSVGRLAQAWQFDYVFLHVKAANTKAVRLYEAVGFEEVSRRKVGGLVGGEDQLLMRCLVSKLVDLDPLQPL